MEKYKNVTFEEVSKQDDIATSECLRAYKMGVQYLKEWVKENGSIMLSSLDEEFDLQHELSMYAVDRISVNTDDELIIGLMDDDEIKADDLKAENGLTYICTLAQFVHVNNYELLKNVPKTDVGGTEIICGRTCKLIEDINNGITDKYYMVVDVEDDNVYLCLNNKRESKTCKTDEISMVD